MGLPRCSLPVLVLAGLCLVAGIAGYYKLREARQFQDTRALLAHFPAEDGTVLRIDVALIRQAGLLAGSQLPQESEYKEFLDGTGFDYRRDLDSVVATFSRSGNFFIARGRFDWAKLRAFAAGKGGSCYQDLCRVQGSTPDRHISFLPLRDDTIALAVSTDDLAASRLTKAGMPVTAPLPEAPVWISVPGAELRREGALPPGLRLMLSSLTNTDRVVVTLGPAASGIEAALEANCKSVDDARVLASQLRNTTALLKDALSKEGLTKAKPDEFAAMLTTGSFDQTDRKVVGKWPVTKSLLAAMTDGL